jgi:hypothetical protein
MRQRAEDNHEACSAKVDRVIEFTEMFAARNKERQCNNRDFGGSQKSILQRMGRRRGGGGGNRGGYEMFERAEASQHAVSRCSQSAPLVAACFIALRSAQISVT